MTDREGRLLTHVMGGWGEISNQLYEKQKIKLCGSLEKGIPKDADVHDAFALGHRAGETYAYNIVKKFLKEVMEQEG